jgi:hypothetical protein
LSADTLAVTRAGCLLLAPLTHAQQPGLLPEHQLHVLCDRKLYTLASYEGNPDDILKLSDLPLHNAIPEALHQLHTSKSPNVPPIANAKLKRKLSPGSTLLLDSNQHTLTSSQLPTSQSDGVSKSNVDNSLHAGQLNVELKLPDSGSPETNATTHKDARLDQAAAVVPEILGNNPHTAEAVCLKLPEKLVNKPPMIVASSDDCFNESNHQLSMLVDKRSQSWLHVVGSTWLLEVAMVCTVFAICTKEMC